MIANYVRLIIFALGLLIGIQAPGFVDQYAKRVSAHRSEIAHDFAGFQQAANQYFGGSIEALVAHHLASTDHAFHDEGVVIRDLYQRLARLTDELAAMSGPLIRQMLHVAFRPNKEILEETWSEYSYTVPLNAAAITTGIVLGALAAMLVEALLHALVRMTRPRRHLASRPLRHH